MAVELFVQNDPEEHLEQQNARENRFVKVTCNDTGNRPFLDLSWHTGTRGRRTILKLTAGQTVTMPVGKAQAFFGHFTIPHDLQDERDENIREREIKLFKWQRAYCLNLWGGYPVARRLEDPTGGDPIGPHRFPDVTVTVIEQDGTEWEPIRLHEMYGIGAFDPNVFAPIVTPEQADAKERKLQSEIDALKAQVATLVALLTPQAVAAQNAKLAPVTDAAPRPKQ